MTGWFCGGQREQESSWSPAVGVQQGQPGSDSLADLSELKAWKLVTRGQVEKMGTLCLSGAPTPSFTSGCVE